MTVSLRSRLILGMFAGMTVLLAAAGATIYTVQRRQLYGALDATLLNGANALTLLVHRGPPGYRLDSAGLERLSASLSRQGALFQIWSDRSFDMLPFPRDEDPAQEDPDRISSPPFDRPPWGDLPPPDHPFFGRESRRGPPPLLNENSDRWPPHVSGETVIRSPALNDADLPRLDAPINKPRFDWIAMPDESRGRAVALRVQLPASGFRSGLGPRPLRNADANLVAVVAAGTAGIDEQLNFLAALLVAIAVCTVAVSGAVAWLVVSRGLRPLGAAAGQIAAMDETCLKERIADSGIPREIRPIVDQFNELLGRLDEAFDRERVLTADIAHELRTPVAEIRAVAEVASSRPRDAREYRQALGDIKDTIATLQGLIEKLLILARLETGQVKPELTSIEPAPLVAEQWALVHAAARARGVTLENRCPQDTLVLADPKLLEMVLANVLSNAAEYAQDGGRVVVDAERAGARSKLTVANPGCPLDEDELARVFDRFWRADAARSGSGLNCGLGLALVRRAMEAMGGEADATVNDERWFAVVLTFPCRAPSPPRDGGSGL